MKKLKFALMLAMVFGVIFSFFGCGMITVQTPPGQSMCANIPAGSYSVICQIATRLNTTPEAIGNFIKIGNVAALAADKYTAQQANAFIDDIVAFLKTSQTQGLTYAALMMVATQKYKALPAKVQAIFIALNGTVKIQSTDITQLALSDYDYATLFKYLAQQKAVIAPFLTQ